MGTLVRDSSQLTPPKMRMRDASLLFFTFSAVSGHSFGWGWNSGSAFAFLQQNGLQTQLPRWRFLNLPFPNNPPNPGWSSAWEEVDQVVGEAPPQRLMINWANNVEIVEPNATTSVGLMTNRPRLTWPSEPGALYTVMVIDAGIQRVLPKVYMHWMVANIPGNSVELGNEVMEYVTPFSLEVEEDPLDGFVKDRQASAHPSSPPGSTTTGTLPASTTFNCKQATTSSVLGAALTPWRWSAGSPSAPERPSPSPSRASTTWRSANQGRPSRTSQLWVPG